MKGIKVWFIQKEHIASAYGKELTIKKETEKAVLVSWKVYNSVTEHWIPKSCITDGWEKDTTNFGYHEYLVNVVNESYTNGTLENKTFKSGRNVYDQTSFTHQSTTKGLINFLEKMEIPFMNREEWNNR